MPKVISDTNFVQKKSLNVIEDWEAFLVSSMFYNEQCPLGCKGVVYSWVSEAVVMSRSIFKAHGTLLVNDGHQLGSGTVALLVFKKNVHCGGLGIRAVCLLNALLWKYAGHVLREGPGANQNMPKGYIGYNMPPDLGTYHSPNGDGKGCR